MEASKDEEINKHLARTGLLQIKWSVLGKLFKVSLSPPPCVLSRMVFFLEDVMACTKRLLEVIAGWLPRHFIGAILISLPAIAVFSHFTSEFENNIYVSCAVLGIICWGMLLSVAPFGSSSCPSVEEQANDWCEKSQMSLEGDLLFV